MPGAEAWSASGNATEHPARARVGLGLVHGFTGNPVSLRPLAEKLCELGFRLDVPRLPGHGTHVRDMQKTRYADWRQEVERTALRLRAACDHVVLLGFSMGATLVLDVASGDERGFAGVIAVNPLILDREGPIVKIAPLLEYVLPLAPAMLAGLRKDDIAKPGVSERAYDWVPTAAGNSLVRELPRVREQLSRLKCPVLVAHSKQDHSVPPANSAALLKLLPQAEELLFERSYHVVTLDYDFEILLARVAAFADAVAGTRA